jgi:hypothetical protein
MQYPSDWRVESVINSSLVALFIPHNASNVAVDMSINNLTTSSTPDEFVNNLMRGDAAASKDFPGIKFTIHTTSNVVLAGHPGFLLVGTFNEPTSGALEGFTNIGTIIGDKAYSIQYYSPEQTYPVYRTTYSQMIKSFGVISPQNQAGNQTEPPTTTTPPTTSSPTTYSWIPPFVLFVIIVIIIIAIAYKIKHRGGKYRERQDFSDSINAHSQRQPSRVKIRRK